MTAEADVLGDRAEGDGAPAGRKKKPVLAAAAVLVVLAAGAGGAGYSLGLFSGSEQVAAPAAAPEQERQRPVVFYDLPEMTVNLASEGRAAYLRVRIALEVADKSVISQIEPYLPRILDAFQIYLRELRPSDLEGSSGLVRLKEELLRRINTAVHPARVDGVLFKEILVQ